jgi:hypothetical protein
MIQRTNNTLEQIAIELAKLQKVVAALQTQETAPPGAATDHTTLTNIGTNTHDQIDTFMAATVDHTALSNIGTNTHDQIDTHLAAATDHGSTTGLADDDHTQYALLAGRSGGQVLSGGSNSGDNLTLESTIHATNGYILIPDGDRVGIGTLVPQSELHVAGSNTGGTQIRFENISTGGRVYVMLTTGELSSGGPGKYQIVDSATGNRLVYDGVNNRLGIATISPASTLHVVGDHTQDGKTIFTRSDLTIASGVITVTKSYHRVDTQAAAATDDLDTISGMTTGQVVILTTVNSVRDVVVKHGTGNIFLAANTDFTLSNSRDHIMLICTGTEIVELSRSKNS